MEIDILTTLVIIATVGVSAWIGSAFLAYRLSDKGTIFNNE